MIKPAEFLSHIFCMLYWSYERISCFASNHLDQNWLYQGFHERFQEGEKTEVTSSLPSEFVFTPGIDVQ